MIYELPNFTCSCGWTPETKLNREYPGLLSVNCVNPDCTGHDKPVVVKLTQAQAIASRDDFDCPDPYQF